MFFTATNGSRAQRNVAALAEHMRARSGMVVAEPAEHEVGGLHTEGEHSLTGFEGRSPLREGEPDGSRSRISQPIGADDDPIRREAKWPGQDCVHSAIGLMGQDIVGWPGSRTLRRRRAVQK